MANPSSLAGIVLAAGAGTRFGGPKAPYLYEGQRLVDRAVSLMREAELDPVIVVLGSWTGAVPHCETVINPDFEQGLASSLAYGLDYLRTHHPQAPGVIITLVDLPFIRSSTIRLLVDSESDLAQAHFHGEPGHPVKIGARYWSAVMEQLNGDTGAKEFLRTHHAEAIEINDPGIVQDLDQRPS